jgi:hypothetical protein
MGKYKVKINGSFSGSFNSTEEAMKLVEDRAIRFNRKWEIRDELHLRLDPFHEGTVNWCPKLGTRSKGPRF